MRNEHGHKNEILANSQSDFSVVLNATDTHYTLELWRIPGNHFYNIYAQEKIGTSLPKIEKKFT
jgi:hypothetical protein